MNSGVPWKLGIGSWVLILAVTAGCGKKGPPLPPIVRVPAAVSQLTARRVGDDVILNLALPAQNVDQSTPVNLARVDVYGYTGRTAPPAPRFTEVAQLVGKIDSVPGAPPPGTTVRDALTSDKLVEGPALTRAGSTAKNAIPSKDDTHTPLRRRSAELRCRSDIDATARFAARRACDVQRRSGDRELGAIRRLAGFPLRSRWIAVDVTDR